MKTTNDYDDIFSRVNESVFEEIAVGSQMISF